MDRPRASRLRQQLRQTEEARRGPIEVIISSESLVVGSFVTIGRKCGKPTCRCVDGDKHLGKYLSRSEGGRTRLLYVPSGDEVEVALKADRYRRLRQARAELMKLSAKAAELADALVEALAEPYPPPSSETRKRDRPRRRERADDDDEA